VNPLHLAENAACRNADPRAFDATDHVTASLALWYCRRCPVVDLCNEIVRPAKSYYDGVAAGRVWRNGLLILADGTVIGPRSRRIPHEQLTLVE